MIRPLHRNDGLLWWRKSIKYSWLLSDESDAANNVPGGTSLLFIVNWIIGSGFRSVRKEEAADVGKPEQEDGRGTSQLLKYVI
ncbi:uncharacterized protein IL334_004644 [Kwoniella shivajii]|uniref:Uncharacterized protein n=1 Tax=Kwoniella shivajii TaxID=564305 RepID=A0ABZ1D0X1_9TREE|nr:hypothetical protein IL334_004644 [Kwoniella shivajii]